ncbi:PAS domain-containing sensor histidine kinase [Lysobacter terrae]
MSIDSKIEVTPWRAGPDRRYWNVFENPGVAFVEIDFSDVGAMVRSLRASGVVDLKTHLLEHPHLVREMMHAARIVAANEHAVDLFSPGRRQDLLGSLEPYWPDASIAVFAESVVAAVDDDPSFLRETVMRTVQGVEFDAELAVHFDPENTNSGFVTVAIADITERNRARAAFEHAEFMYRNMFYGMAVPFLRVDSTRLWEKFARLREEGVVDIDAYFAEHPGFVRAAMEVMPIVEANEAAVQLHRAGCEAEVLGPISRFWAGGSDQAIRDSFAAGFRGEAGFQGEARMLTLDGNEVDVLMLIIATPEMRTKGIVLVGLIDITEQVAARSALESMRSDLAHATRVSVLGELTASIAHEINQPLAAITTSSEAALRWLARPDLNVDELRALMTRVVADAHRAADVVDRVRCMAMRRTTQAEPIAINSVVEEVATFLQHELHAHDVALSLDLAPHLEHINADRIEMQQVILNLSVNAMQAMVSVPADRRRLRIVTGPADAKSVFVRVQDSGPGIPPDRIPRLFESFYSTREGGMGMGLRICRSIVEAHDGHIEASNNKDGGADFRVTLPTSGKAPQASC